jgi:hypothetical protein
MERITDDGKIAFKKVGGSCIRWNGKLIKPGEIVRLNPDEVAASSFKDLLIPQEKIREKNEPPLEIAKTEYSLKPRGKSKSLYDVVDSQGKVLNDKALTKEVATDLIKELSK